MDKLDYKKEYKDLYLPKQKPMLIAVPKMHFIMVDGAGAPSGNSYQEAIELLYTFSYTIKMSKLGDRCPQGYFEYVVPPLEGLWWLSEPGNIMSVPKEAWLWTAMIRQPEFVTQTVFDHAAESIKAKKPALQVERARFAAFDEGLCVQVMHVGPFDEEQRSIDKIDAFISENGLINCVGQDRKHHEIYLSDPRKSNPKNLRTVLRVPVEHRG